MPRTPYWSSNIRTETPLQFSCGFCCCGSVQLRGPHQNTPALHCRFTAFLICTPVSKGHSLANPPFLFLPGAPTASPATQQHHQARWSWRQCMVVLQAGLQAAGSCLSVLLGRSEACDEDGSGTMTFDEMLSVFRKCRPESGPTNEAGSQLKATEGRRISSFLGAEVWKCGRDPSTTVRRTCACRKTLSNQRKVHHQRNSFPIEVCDVLQLHSPHCLPVLTESNITCLFSLAGDLFRLETKPTRLNKIVVAISSDRVEVNSMLENWRVKKIHGWAKLH